MHGTRIVEGKKVVIDISPGFNYDTDFPGDYERFSQRNKFMISLRLIFQVHTSSKDRMSVRISAVN